MPYSRPTLSELRQQVAADISSLIRGADGLLRFGNLPVISTALAGLANLHYGYLDWISLMSVPWTSQGEFLEGWAALVNIIREDATAATGTATFPGTNGMVLPAGSLITRSDQRTFITAADGTVSAGFVTVTITDQKPGSAGNTLSGTAMNISTAIAGISSSGVVTTALTGGTDVESDASLMARMLQRFQKPPQGGSANDYIVWARQINTVTRAWTLRNGQGSGTVVVYFMMDESESAFNGFPQGTNGVATLEPRDIPATGDQLTVANYIFPLQPVPALVYACAPTASPQNFTIAGLNPNTADMKTAIGGAIADAFFRLGSPLNVAVPFADIEQSINAVPGLIDFIITSPTADVNPGTGFLPTLGVITWV